MRTFRRFQPLLAAVIVRPALTLAFDHAIRAIGGRRRCRAGVFLALLMSREMVDFDLPVAAAAFQ
jgi:hypothetical protein